MTNEPEENDVLAEAKEQFEAVSEAEQENRNDALDDLKFARLGQQWPAEIETQRRQEGRPYLTINRMPAFIRQVVNDARHGDGDTDLRSIIARIRALATGEQSK